MIDGLQQNYGDFFEPALIKEITSVGTFREVSEGDELIRAGSYIKSMPLIINGAIKILRQDTEGDELLLYFLERGDTCAMTLSCCLGHHKSEIKAIAETDASLVMIPVEKMEEWTTRYKSWRNFVFDSYHKRLIEAIETIDSIAFLKMDDRLLKYLHDKSKVTSDNVLKNTHQEIAYDLHTSRVVISRLLKKLETKGKVKLNRNSIEVIDL
ncbi:Crp/Fnr family transcriptional regulator [Aquimarina spongiae]|uniref:CRP/FNR family transcriptional regulator, anaerobic regulatory protein n=1 Tax=Aquimarina spongiae TaxID=570521 RepID=A0A1M6I8K5_9FLAO|nr:Crp/Fnr family transcriptional regulator [Aquimarina spongiae]SHJ30794.1 CRP/FNR family transcriptional regulator, anaerobic regulatory protein [Aquimarina spongiae]